MLLVQRLPHDTSDGFAHAGMGMRADQGSDRFQITNFVDLLKFIDQQW
jgi:hypothetical protein